MDIVPSSVLWSELCFLNLASRHFEPVDDGMLALFDVSCVAQFSLWYHMYGSTVSSLEVSIKVQNTPRTSWCTFVLCGHALLSALYIWKVMR